MSRRAPALLVAFATSCGGSTPAPEVQPGGATSSPAFRAGDAIAYAIKVPSGSTIGRVHSLYVDGGDGLVQVRTRVAAAAFGGEDAHSAERVVTLNGDLTPKAYKELSSRDGRLELRFSDRAVTVVAGTAAREVPYARDGAVLLPRADLMTLALALGRAGLTPGTAVKLAVLSPKSPAAREEERVLVTSDATGALVAEWARGRATFDADGRIARFDDRESALVYEREGEPGEPPRVEAPAEPATYVPPKGASWRDRELVIDVRDGQLAATLSEPSRRPAGGRAGAPAVLYLSDLGLQDRHGFGEGVDHATWQLHDHLADAGYAVLRADDRGTGGSTSEVPPGAVGLELAVEDGLRCLEVLRAQPGVDPERIFVIGHGVGGVAAVQLAARAQVTGLVLLATPFRRLAAVLAAERAAAGGGDARALEQELDLAVLAHEGNEAARAKVPSAKLAEVADLAALLRESGKLDLGKALAEVKVEVAVFQGMKDLLVSWREDMRPLGEALKRAGNKRVKLNAYENVDHLMKSEPLESSRRRYADRSRRLDPKVLEDLTAWLDERSR